MQPCYIENSSGVGEKCASIFQFLWDLWWLASLVCALGVVSSTFQIAQILVQSHFELHIQFGSSSRSNWTGIWTGNSNGSWTDKQSPHFSTVKISDCYIPFHVTITTNRFWNDGEMMLNSLWTSHLQMMNWLDPLF